MSSLVGQVGKLSMTIQVKRKETGKVEEYTLESTTTPEQHKAMVELMKQEKKDGGNA